MKIAVVHGQAHKGSTWHITQLLIERLNCTAEDVSEFYAGGIEACVGCMQCFLIGEAACPHRSQTEPIIKAIEEADVIIIDSPTYVFQVTGQLKIFFDHMGYRWMSHRPYPAMKQKIGVAVSTAAGAGAKRTTKEIALQMFWWTIGRTYELPFVVAAMSWEEIPVKRKRKIEKKIERTAVAIRQKVGHVKPGIKARFLFFVMRQMHKKMDYNPVESDYWKQYFS